MQYTVETHLWDFKPWGGAICNFNELKNHPDAFSHIENCIESWCEECGLTDTDINDFLWFDMYNELEEAGYVDENLDWLDEEDDEDEEED